MFIVKHYRKTYMKTFEIKFILTVITVLAVISFIDSNYFEGIMLLVISIILLVLDTLPQKPNYFESGRYIHELNVSPEE